MIKAKLTADGLVPEYYDLIHGDSEVVQTIEVVQGGPWVSEDGDPTIESIQITPAAKE